MRSMRKIGIVGLLSVLLAACAAPASERATNASNGQAAQTMVVYKSPTCGCCSDWVSYVEEHGFAATVEEVPDMAPVKVEHNVPPMMQSCHTALIDGYVVEGHVPVEEIERLLAERPDVTGIAVPGMPVGSPGMEMPGAATQPFDVVTFDESGNTEVFASYPQ